MKVPALGITFGVLAALFIGNVKARDLGQWTDSALRKWYQGLMQPDNAAISCCGEADAYWADSFEMSPHGEYVAIITDTRNDDGLQRPHLDVGTKIVVPNHKLNRDRNPTGHGVIFLSRFLYVYCYFAPGGV